MYARWIYTLCFCTLLTATTYADVSARQVRELTKDLEQQTYELAAWGLEEMREQNGRLGKTRTQRQEIEALMGASSLYVSARTLSAMADLAGEGRWHTVRAAKRVLRLQHEQLTKLAKQLVVKKTACNFAKQVAELDDIGGQIDELTSLLNPKPKPVYQPTKWAPPKPKWAPIVRLANTGKLENEAICIATDDRGPLAKLTIRNKGGYSRYIRIRGINFVTKDGRRICRNMYKRVYAGDCFAYELPCSEEIRSVEIVVGHKTRGLIVDGYRPRSAIAASPALARNY